VSGSGPEQPDAGVQPAIPAMPRISPGMVYRGTPDLLADYGVRYSLGWQDHRKAGPSFVIARLRWSGTRVKARFPLTEQGWESAWRTLSRVDPSAVAVVAEKLAARAERDSASAALDALDNASLSDLRRVTFKGGSGGVPLSNDQPYELRFLGDRITVSLPRRLDPVVTIPYPDVDAVEVSGSGTVGKPLGELLVWVLGCGLIGAILGVVVLGVIGLLLGAVLFGLIGAIAGSASTRVETVVRIRTAEAELYFQNVETNPDALRIRLSAALAAIEAARGTPSDHAEAPAESPSGSIPDQLGKLASLLEDGTITQDEFEHLKARLISSV
jgi:Short C-terminal domain